MKLQRGKVESVRRWKAQRGFSLVEMAVVLVIIGLILGAVMIGRDAQRNAEYVKIRQTFVNQWAVAYNTYVQRTGAPVGDDLQAPTLIVNGQDYRDRAQPTGGDLSNAKEPPMICHGGKPPETLRDADGKPERDLRTLMLQAGVELPQGRGQGQEDRYVYRDTNGNPQELQVCFQWNKPGTASGSGNVMVIAGLTPDLARSLASAINGNASNNTGSFRQEGATTGALVDTGKGLSQGTDWGATNTDNYVGASATNREAQVRTVVAHYKMNQ